MNMPDSLCRARDRDYANICKLVLFLQQHPFLIDRAVSCFQHYQTSMGRIIDKLAEIETS